MKNKTSSIDYLIPNSNSAKYNFFNDSEEIIQMWLADMDFSICNAAKETLQKFVDNGDLGYGFIPEKYYYLVLKWLKKYHKIELTRTNICVVSSVISSLHIAIEEFSNINDYIAYFSPAYHAFKDTVIDMDRKILEIPLTEKEEEYIIDYDLLDKTVKQKKPKILIFNNPHNPTGKVFLKSDIEKIVYIAKKYQMLIISDEIHMDFFISM